MIAKPIYLDYMSTTPIDPEVIAAMMHYMGPDARFANPASVQHVPGRDLGTGSGAGGFVLL